MPEAITEVASGIFAALKHRHENKSTLLVLVYLPVESEYMYDSEWHAWASAEAEQQGLLFVDLLPELQRLPEDPVSTYFIQRGPQASHYSLTGNRWAAKIIYENLQKLPEVQSALESIPSLRR